MTRDEMFTKLTAALTAVIANHCPNADVYCSTCYHARDLLAQIAAAAPTLTVTPGAQRELERIAATLPKPGA